MSFVELGLSEAVCSVVSSLNFSEPTPVQKQAIPLALAQHDLIVQAQTGTGKTAAFGLSILESLQSPSGDDVYALIVVPTRELAQQVLDMLNALAKPLGQEAVALYGGVSIEPQKKHLLSKPRIVIGTPGRLLDHLHLGTLTLNALRFFILDEADRMLDMGFSSELKRLMRRLPSSRQTLLFSATYDKPVRDLANQLTHHAKQVTLESEALPTALIEQRLYQVDRKRKREFISYLIGSNNWQQVLVFAKTKQGCEQLCDELKLDGLKAASMHGDKSQGARNRALDDFKQGAVRVLVATDVAARGIDIPQLSPIINYDLPHKIEDYVHRIGRTGRAGEAGLAISIMTPGEEAIIEKIEQQIDQRLAVLFHPGYEPTYDEVAEPNSRRSRGSEKRRMKQRLKIHANRGKNSRR